jgi:hypothetical protein
MYESTIGTETREQRARFFLEEGSSTISAHVRWGEFVLGFALVMAAERGGGGGALHPHSNAPPSHCATPDTRLGAPASRASASTASAAAATTAAAPPPPPPHRLGRETVRMASLEETQITCKFVTRLPEALRISQAGAYTRPLLSST